MKLRYYGSFITLKRENTARCISRAVLHTIRNETDVYWKNVVCNASFRLK